MIVKMETLTQEDLIAALRKAMRQISKLVDENNKLLMEKEKLRKTTETAGKYD